MALIHEIPITEIKGLSMGHAQDREAKTGVTVLLFDKDRGAVTGCDISGGGPASRETPLTSPVTADLSLIHIEMCIRDRSYMDTEKER